MTIRLKDNEKNRSGNTNYHSKGRGGEKLFKRLHIFLT